MDLSVLNEPYALTRHQIESYKENGFIKIKDVLPARILAHFNAIISSRVELTNNIETPLSERTTYGKAFLQLVNLWTQDEKIKELVFSKRLAQIASDLLEVDGVRMYHDQALFKEAGGGITPWHADQYYWPLSSNKTVTAWVPLQDTPLEMGPLEFSAKSQNIILGRELAIGDESESVIRQNLRINNFEQVVEGFDIGEVSFHSGWVFHRAGANVTDEVRKVMTVIYIDKDMNLREPQNEGQRLDWETWCPGVEIGAIINSDLNPILFERK